jgi:hypothetical protein
MANVLPDEAIAGAAYRNGLGSTREGVAKWVAIALAESDGDARAKNDVGAGHTGLWQISGLHAGAVPGSPSNRAAFREWLYLPYNNAKAAKYVYDRQGYGAWEVVTNGRYLSYMGRARAVPFPPSLTAGSQDASLLDPNTWAAAASALVPDPMEKVATAAINIGEAIVDAGAWVADPSNWSRVALVGIGAAALLLALNAVAKPITDPVLDQAAKVAGSVK